MKIKKQKWGVLSDGSKVHLYTVSNNEMSFSCTDYGCTITSIVVKDKNKVATDVIVGHSTFDGYLNSDKYFGAVVGRFANRIGKASFSIGNKEYKLDKNDGPNTLHGGFDGYNKKLWKAKIVEEKKYSGVEFTRISPDGEQGFPGNCEISVSYLLDENNNLICLYKASSDKDTPINLTNHSYFNLAGNGNIGEHILKMNSTQYLEVNSKLIPTGKFINVKGTPFDFTKEKKIGKDIKEVGVGYDHCYVTEIYDPANPNCGLPLNASDLVEFCTVYEPNNGIEMSVYTNMEGCQFYTANFIKGTIGKHGRVYNSHDAFCLETQCFPDTPNKPDWPTCILRPGEVMVTKTIYSFGVRK